MATTPTLNEIMAERYNYSNDQFYRMHGAAISAGYGFQRKRGAGAGDYKPLDAAAMLIVLPLECGPTAAPHELRDYADMKFRGFRGDLPYVMQCDKGDAEGRMLARDALDLIVAMIDRRRGRRRESLIDFLARLVSDGSGVDELCHLVDRIEKLPGSLDLNVELMRQGDQPRAEVSFSIQIADEKCRVAGLGKAVFADDREPWSNVGKPRPPRTRGSITLSDLIAVRSLMAKGGEHG